MAAATQALTRLVVQNDADIRVSVRLSSMTSDQTESLSYAISRAPYAKPRSADLRIITAPTARCGLFMECDVNSAVAATQLCPVRIYTEAGGDIAGAVVEVHFSFDAIDGRS